MRESLWQRLAYGVRRLRYRADWHGFLDPDWADSIMGLAVTDRFHAKQGRSTGRWILQKENRRLAVYLKRHYLLPRWRGWLAAFWPDAGWSPALQEWRHLEWAQNQGMPVPVAVAAGEYIGPWGRLQSFLAIEELPDMVPLNEAIPAAARQLESGVFQIWKRGLVRELAQLTRKIHQRRYFHKDLYLCHFYVPRRLTEGVFSCKDQIHLIDLHRLKRHPLAWRFWQIKDLAQMLYSSEVGGVDQRDRLRFWRAYLGEERRSWISRLLRRCILLKWRRYRRHNTRQIRRKEREQVQGIPHEHRIVS